VWIAGDLANVWAQRRTCQHHTHMAVSDLEKTGRPSEVKMDMGGSGDPGQTTIIGTHTAHVPDGGRTAGGLTANQFDLQCKTKINLDPCGLSGPRRRPANHFDLQL